MRLTIVATEQDKRQQPSFLLQSSPFLSNIVELIHFYPQSITHPIDKQCELFRIIKGFLRYCVEVWSREFVIVEIVEIDEVVEF